MPWQLIYTSAPRGLLSGQSGFCTVARSRDLREALVQRLEQISSYHYLRVAEAATASRNPTVCAFRILDLRGTRYHILTRIQPAGLDFTARTNHLAHHLVFQGHELSALPSPAAILSLWSGWLACWQGEPRLVEDPSLDTFAAGKSFLPANTWLRVTGDAGRAAGLLETEYTRGCYLLCPDGSEQQLLEMYCESLQLLNLHGQYALRPWRHTFTTFLQGEDNPADFHWRACQEGTPACQDALKRGLPLVPLRGVRVPMNSLVKSARDGAKPLPPSSSAPAPALKRAQPDEPVKANEPAPPGAGPPSWEEPAYRNTRSRLLDINLSLGSASLMRVGVFVAVLAGLLVVKFVFFKKHPSPEVAPVPVAEVAPKERPVIASVAPSPAKPDLSDLNWLPADEPTYVLILSRPANFELPINAISRFQNLLNRYDHLDVKPADIRLAANMDQWNFQGGAPLTVQRRQDQTLDAKSESGLECSFDYANWKSDPQTPLYVRTSFTTPPAAFSMRFGFSNAQDGEPFRLLIINQSNPPVPLRLGKEWIRADGDGLVGSLTPPLGERLQGDFIPMGAWHWQLEPFIGDRKGSQTNWLYQHWPAEDLPPPGSELDFVRTKSHLAGERQSLETKAASLTAKIRHQIDGANFDTPLAADLRVEKPELASFSAYVSDPSTDDFLQYLNALKRAAKAKGPPHFDDNEDESSLAAKFEQWHDWWIDKVPEAKAKLTVGGTNYFAAVWQSLKGIDKIRLEKQGVADKIQRLRAEMKEVPESLDKVAYVGLYLTSNSRPGLEVIRFAGP